MKPKEDAPSQRSRRNLDGGWAEDVVWDQKVNNDDFCAHDFRSCLRGE